MSRTSNELFRPQSNAPAHTLAFTDALIRLEPHSLEYAVAELEVVV